MTKLELKQIDVCLELFHWDGKVYINIDDYFGGGEYELNQEDMIKLIKGLKNSLKEIYNKEV